ncbi:MAG: molybdenum hydroxylase [Candidatus Thermofonsia Clade 3 bacterium]|jgi:xanthine dehydrogenase accessory factor|uniref:Molybdenum hydroxylase n=1 Tax=Candidatus Thermofonsia Clade 3 bacterium TaxID=2364212 RepID=A0A2M8QA11_9CHLR|nr:selenium-dependent molybdenum cofactor biosynthesis protein YqeB [Candidatus Roseilinea sp. NK_OTU-006]PJF46648.1 MAG: molybdenum hydroxylase [Candidatus Thermofonsia Clade 3 bacterium]
MAHRDIPIAIVKGAGDLGTGVAYRLWKCGFRVLCTDLEKPLVIRRTVAFASALYDGRITVEGVPCERVFYADEAIYLWQRNTLAVIADPVGRVVESLQPEVVVDAIMAKRNVGTTIHDAPCVVALGPGFVAGEDCHAVIETQRGHDLGRVIWSGSASPNTGMPGKVGGEDARRVVRAPRDGLFYGRRAIGDSVEEGEVIAQIEDAPVHAPLGGVLRGLLHDGVQVSAGLKVADIDPRGEPRYCFSISDKALAIAGGVLEAVFSMRERWQTANGKR